MQGPISWGANWNHGYGIANGLGGGNAGGGAGCVGNLPCNAAGGGRSGTNGFGGAYGVGHNVVISGGPFNYANSGSQANTWGNSNSGAWGSGSIGAPNGSGASNNWISQGTWSPWG